ncbi:MAG: sterol desaturase family protein [Deltaproteobacteria bacterium]|nr:sterol desaturase family protein [Deltaproteobacteria bacterium]MCB9786287.1 sterol desaturase family protein [Deltaproteobacteria bacterium]
MLYLVLFLAGLLLGSLADYLIHRFVGHGPGAPASKAPLLSRHGQVHHVVFNARRGMAAARGEARRSHIHLQFSAFVILLLLIVIAGAALLPFSLADRENWFKPSAALMAGLFTALISYDALHRMHHSAVPRWIARTPLYRQLREWHYEHHEDPDSRFAVLLPLWDYVFFTQHGLAEAAPAGRAEDEPVEESQGRTRPTTSMRALLRDTMMAADAEVAEPEPPKSKRERRKEAKAEAAAPRTKLGTGVSARPVTNTTAPKTRSGASSRSAGKTTGAKWLNVMDTSADAGGIQVKAVKDEED